ncbi:MAG: hypothetical protein R3B96_10485 [Pirellulaceae bacterium]
MRDHRRGGPWGWEAVVYVETRAKDKGRHVDIAIQIHYRDGAGHDHAVDIESYNPFFGCDVALLEWFDDNVAILVYREKHWTFVYRVGDRWPPAFVKIEDRWQIKDAVLSYRAYQADSVNRLSIPSLEPLASVTNAEAESLGQMPPDPYAGGFGCWFAQIAARIKRCRRARSHLEFWSSARIKVRWACTSEWKCTIQSRATISRLQSAGLGRFPVTMAEHGECHLFSRPDVVRHIPKDGKPLSEDRWE